MRTAVLPPDHADDTTTVLCRALTRPDHDTIVERSNMQSTLMDRPIIGTDAQLSDAEVDATNRHIASLAPTWFYMVNLLIRAGDSPAEAVALCDECIFGL